MDTRLPNMKHACEAGLPDYPPELAKQVRTWMDMPFDDLTPEQIHLLDIWVKEREYPIRLAHELHGDHQESVFRALGWAKRKDRKSKKAARNENTGRNGKDSPVGTVEAGAKEREALQGSLSAHRPAGQLH